MLAFAGGLVTVECSKPASGWPMTGLVVRLGVPLTLCGRKVVMAAHMTVPVAPNPGVSLLVVSKTAACTSGSDVTLIYEVAASTNSTVSLNVSSSAAAVRCHVSGPNGEETSVTWLFSSSLRWACQAMIVITACYTKSKLRFRSGMSQVRHCSRLTAMQNAVPAPNI